MSSMGSNLQPQQKCNFQETVQITQKDQAQTYSNSTMCHTLSAAENLAYRICLEHGDKNLVIQLFEGYKQILPEQYQKQKLIFDAYDSYDGGKVKSIPDLATQLIFLIENFKGVFSNYISQYQKYDYPSNVNEEQTQKLIKHWLHIIQDIELVNPKFRQYVFSKYYINLFYVLTNQPSINYVQDIYNLQANNPNKVSINPIVMRNEYPNILRNQNEYLEKNAINKKVDLFKDNTLKKVGSKPNHLNNDSLGKGKGIGGGSGGGGGKGGAKGREHGKGVPQTHGGQGNFGGGNNFQDDNIDESNC